MDSAITGYMEHYEKDYKSGNNNIIFYADDRSHISGFFN